MRSTRTLIAALICSALICSIVICSIVICSALIPLTIAGLFTPLTGPDPGRAKTMRIQNAADADVDVGSLLCADRSLKDPNFAQTVVLVVKYDDEGTLGLILNRRSEVSISKLLDDWKEAKGHNEPIFVGGPVEEGTLLALVRSRAKSDEANTVLREVRLVSDRTQLQHLLQNTAAGSDRFRLYAGYAGWAPEQLEEEIDVGAWHIFPADANTVFDPEPDSLWTRIIKRTETQIALAF